MNVFRQFFSAVFHELHRSRYIYNLLAIAIFAAALGFRFYWQEPYVTQARIALAPSAVSGSEEHDKVEQVDDSDHILALTQMLNSPAFVNQLKEYSIDIETGVSILAESNNTLKLSYTTTSPDLAKEKLQLITDKLLDNMQPIEKREAINVELQALLAEEERLRGELVAKESKLLEKSVVNVDFDSQKAKARIDETRDKIQDVEVSINAVNAKIDGIVTRIENEETLQAQRKRLAELSIQQEKVATALEESHGIYAASDPEVLLLQAQLDSIRSDIQAIKDEGFALNDEPSEESFVKQLRAELALQELEKASLQTRYDALRELLQKEIQQASKSQTQTVAFSRLKRDLDALELSYEDAKKARKKQQQMLDELDAKTPKFTLQDKPSEPVRYSGVELFELLIIAPVAAFCIPFLFAFLRIFFSIKLRTSRQVRYVSAADIPLLGVVPRYESPKAWSIVFRIVLASSLWAGFVVSAHNSLGVAGYLV